MTQTYKTVTFILLLIISSISAQNCNLPSGEKSMCVRLHRCDHFAKIYQKYNGRPPQNVLTDIRNHLCTQQNTVCCPDNAEVVTPSNIRGTSTTTPPTATTQKTVVPNIVDYNSLRSHRNLKLLNNQECGQTTMDKIVDGWDANIQEIPWQAILGYTIRNDFSTSWGCGGALISPRYVITASHCINRDLKVVRLGEHTLSKVKDCDQFDECNDPIQDIMIEKTIRNPNFNRFEKINDIALIRLSSSADLNRNNIKTVCLPFDAKDDIETVLRNAKTKLPMTISGFGRLGNGVREPSDILQKAFVPFVRIDECQNLYRQQQSNVNLVGQFCAGGQNKTDSCRGDSGGPITNVGSKGRMMLYGVVVGGVDCENPNKTPIPGVYTDIRYYLPWILDTITA